MRQLVLAHRYQIRARECGNNNAYCQDNDTTWYDWRYLRKHEDIYRLTRDMIALRRAHPTLARERFYTDAEISWCNASHGAPDWADPHAGQLACLIDDGTCDPLYLMFNAGGEAAAFLMPEPPSGRSWCVAVDTYRDSSSSLFVPGHGPVHDTKEPY